MDNTYIKIDDVTGKIITPQPNKEEELSVEDIKREIEGHNKDILFHQQKVMELVNILAEFEKVGINISDKSIEPIK